MKPADMDAANNINNISRLQFVSSQEDSIEEIGGVEYAIWLRNFRSTKAAPCSIQNWHA